LLLQLQDLILRLSLLNLKLLKVINTTKLYTLTTKIANFFLETIAIFILTNKKKTQRIIYI